MPSSKPILSYGTHWVDRVLGSVQSCLQHMAYNLLAVVRLLVYSNLPYIREKLQLGLKRSVGALHEGIRHSERPELFDCHEIEFPTHQTRS